MSWSSHGDRWLGSERGRLSFSWELGNVPLPRVSVVLLASGRDGEVLWVTLELSDRGSDPVASVALELPWRRPRPWECDVTLPPKGPRDLRWRWRSPLR